ncbi:MAG: exodeoxyribonuclease III [Bdellovibrionales bacterium]|nr:exodeoxyribonuclease III [Bdellovibrionales bacterium]
MKIVTWNVNGIRACSKKGFLEFIENYQPDMLCIQETKAHPEQLEPQIKEPFGALSFYSSAIKRGYSGTATYVFDKFKGDFIESDVTRVEDQVSYGIGIKKFDSEGRFVITKQKGFTLYNVYFPNGAAREERHLFKQEFLRKFTKLLERQINQGEEVMVLGDYNVAYLDIDVHDPVRLSKVSGFLPEEREWFKDFLKVGFTDLFRKFYPDATDKYTWWSYRENARVMNRGWRIDHICVSPGLVNKVKSIEILDQQAGSDHCPVLLNIDL